MKLFHNLLPGKLNFYRKEMDLPTWKCGSVFPKLVVAEKGSNQCETMVRAAQIEALGERSEDCV